MKKTVIKLNSIFGKIVTYLENYPIGFWQWLIVFLAIVYIRNLFESFSGKIMLPFPIAYMLQYTLAFINPLLTLSIVLSYFSTERIEKVTRLMLFAWLFTLTPPLFDILLGREGKIIGYLPILAQQPLSYLYLNFFNPFIELPGTTIGIRLETVIACTLSFIYVYIKSNKFSRGILSVFSVYLISITFYTLPYVIFHLWKIVWPALPNATELYLGEGIIVRTPFVRLTFSIANNDLILLGILLLSWCYLYGKDLFQKLINNLFNIRNAMHLAYYILGFLLGIAFFYGRSQFTVRHPFDIVVIISLGLSVLALSGLDNNLTYDKNIIATGVSTRNIIISILAFFALAYPVVFGFGSFAPVLVMCSIVFLRYTFISKHKGLPLLIPAAAALINLCCVFLGFSIFARDYLTKILDHPVIGSFMLIIVLQMLFVFSHSQKAKFICGFAWLVAIILVPIMIKASFTAELLVVLVITIALVLAIIVVPAMVKYSNVLNILFIFVLITLFRQQIPFFSRPDTYSPQIYAKMVLGQYFTISRERQCANIQIEKAIALGCRDLETILTAAYNYSVLGDFEQADTMYRRAIQLDPKSIYAHLGLARLLYAQNQITESQRELEEVLRLDPANKEAQYYLELIKSKSSLPQTAQTELLARAYKEFQANNLDSSLSFAKAALTADSTLVPAYLLVAAIYGKIEQIDSTINYYQQAARLEPKNARSEFVEFLLNRKLWERAIMELKVLANLDSNVSTIFLNLGYCYAQIGQMDLAEQQFLRVIEVDKNDALGWLNLGLIYLNKKEIDKATKSFDEAIRIEPNNVSAHNLLGISYAKQGSKAKAIKEWERCLEIDPNFKEARDNLNKLNE